MSEAGFSNMVDDTLISGAEQWFGGQAFSAEAYRERGNRTVDVDVRIGNQVIEAGFVGRSGVLIGWEV